MIGELSQGVDALIAIEEFNLPIQQTSPKPIELGKLSMQNAGSVGQFHEDGPTATAQKNVTGIPPI